MGLLAIWLTTLTLPAQGYTLLSYDPTVGLNGLRHGGSRGTVARWELDGPIRYRINHRFPEGVSAFGSPQRVEQAVRAAFQAWEAVTTSRVTFAYEGTTDLLDANDGNNVVTFAPRFELPSGFPGGTFPIFWLAQSPEAPRGGISVVDCDLCVAPGARYVLAPDLPDEIEEFDFEGILVHEIGHMLGLDHSGLCQTTMCGYASYGGARFESQLSIDDRMGVTALYPEADSLARLGRIHGLVRLAGGPPVSGAHVVAIEAGSGCAVASCVSGLASRDLRGMPDEFARDSGRFELLLPPGSYRLLVEPFGIEPQGPTWVAGILGSAAAGERFDAAGFAALLTELPIEVVPGGRVGAGEIAVAPLEADSPVVGRASDWLLLDGQQTWTDPARLAPGESGELQISEGVGIVRGGALVAGLRARFLDPRVSAELREPSSAGRVRLHVRASEEAPLGDHVLVLESPHGTTYFPAALRLVAGTQIEGDQP